ncbi:DUF6910 family protein [Cellulomonas cellasea]|uniref:Uncharacterized protein n=1 Tax=Cellulomonas cellasea DSM 20118 TaxID=1408250 RepID=A0A0A0B598_9CELL|nr:hypothetical protein [Cellulomonas cellasea]KGM02000.1 hypothetical protein Q760_16090 [Cellulomonas cellasea DSM 20118]
MQVEVEHVTALRFDDGAPVRAASAVVAFGGGWLVAQDDATHAAWVRPDGVTPVRALPPVRGLDTFEEERGTKALKPDLEAAFVVPGDLLVDLPGGDGAVVLLGSGSSPARVRGCLLRPPGSADAEPLVADLAPLYAAVACRLGVDADLLNLEGACVVGDVLRWFQRGLPDAGVPTASVDVDVRALLTALAGEARPADVPVTGERRYDLGSVRGVGLAVTDAVLLPDGAVLVSAAAEDTPDPRDDGPVVGSVLAVLDGGVVRDRVDLPHVHGGVAKVEGLGVVEHTGDGARLLATVDADDPTEPSLAVGLRVRC